jgi:hypothetical protein
LVSGFTSEWSSDEYLATAVTSVPAKKKADLFGALEKPTTVINFNDTSAASSSKSVFKWSDSEQPKAKKIKLKVAPPKIMLLSEVNYNGFTVSFIHLLNCILNMEDSIGVNWFHNLEKCLSKQLCTVQMMCSDGLK